MFNKTIDTNNRTEMINFLQNHFRYNTGNGCGLYPPTSYANKVKITCLGLESEIEDSLLNMIGLEEAYDPIYDLLYEFGDKYNWKYQACFNGRSGGYIVLMRGGWKYDEHKSFCTACGQRNFQIATESNCRCGRCGKDTRINFKQQPKTHFVTYSSIDQDECFAQWETSDLQSRVKLVSDFDKLCDTVIETAVNMAKNFEVVEEEIVVPKIVRRLKEK